MCGKTWIIAMQVTNYAFEETKFLWFKPRKHVGTYCQIYSQLISTTNPYSEDTKYLIGLSLQNP